jgi:protein SCO1/2
VITGIRLRACGAILSAALVTSVAGCKKEEPFEVLSKPAVPQTLPAYWPMPAFSLTERSGEALSTKDLRGKVCVVDFFYTTCPGPCPMMTSRLSTIQAAVGNLPSVRLVSISADPEKDTPEVLRQYADKFKAGDNWLFLTGEKAAIHDLANKGFKLSIVEMPEAAESITHSTKLVLVDQSGMIRGFYEGAGEDSTPRLVADIHRLIKEQP